MPYFIRVIDGLEVVFDSITEGAVGPDGNPQWVLYEEWLSMGNVPEDRTLD